MKRKFNLMGRVAIALVLALSLCLMTGVPVLALEPPTVDVEPPTINAAAKYTVTIKTTKDLSATADDDIRIAFPEGTIVPADYVPNSISINGTDVVGDDPINVIIDPVTRKFTIDVPIDISASEDAVVIFKTEAGIVNPSITGTYQLIVSTSTEIDPIASVAYSITAPTISKLEPDSGNMGDTMWVEVTGTNFVGDAVTDVSDTDINFGDGINVLQTRYVSPTSIDCEIEIITAGGARTVLAIALGTGVTFTANITGTPQVDVWEKYTPDDDILPADWDEFTLEAQTETMSYATIQAAEAACDGTETVVVHAGTYEEGVSTSLEITLLSLSGADSTIIDGGSTGIIVDVWAAATIDGFTIKGDATSIGQRGLRVRGANVSGFVIQNNKFIDLRSDNIFVTSTDGVINSGTIDSNTCTGTGDDATEGRSGILVQSYSNNAISDVKITNNTLSGFSADEVNAIGVAQEAGAVSAITVQGNIISDSYRGISLWGDVTGMTGTEAISDNTITGCTAGFKASGGDAVAFDLVENTITDNTLYGVWLHTAEPAAQTVTIKYNDLSGNGEWGIFNDWTETVAYDVVATYNWWGHISGPSAGTGTYASTALGSGDAMSREVATWDPWLTETQAKTVEDGIAYLGSTTPLEAGWNTLSVPLALKDSANTLTEIEALGDFLTATNWEVAYQYNPELTPEYGGWENIGTIETDLMPCRGYYIKILGIDDVNFPVLYNGTLGLPAYDLVAGWNLVGSAFGIDRTDGFGIATTSDTTDGQKLVVDALDSIKAKCSVIVSPTMPSQTDPWVTTMTIEADGGTTKMIVGEGYWVFMTDSATLAGFEITPIYKVFLP